MMRFGSGTPKRTSLWSNSRGIAGFLNAAPLTKRERRRRAKGKYPSLARRTIGPDGKARFTGDKAALRKSGYLVPYCFMQHIHFLVC